MNFTRSRSLRESEISTIREVSCVRSTVSVRGWKQAQHRQICREMWTLREKFFGEKKLFQDRTDYDAIAAAQSPNVRRLFELRTGRNVSQVLRGRKSEKDPRMIAKSWQPYNREQTTVNDVLLLVWCYNFRDILHGEQSFQQWNVFPSYTKCAGINYVIRLRVLRLFEIINFDATVNGRVDITQVSARDSIAYAKRGQE